MSEKVKNQIWANEYVDFALLLHSSVSNAADDRYIVKLEPNKGGQPSLVLASNTKRQTIHRIDQWVSAFRLMLPFMLSEPLRTPLL